VVPTITGILDRLDADSYGPFADVRSVTASNATDR
jgi:hypothetical protein